MTKSKSSKAAATEPKPITFTVPVTFQVYNAKGWSHGSLFMWQSALGYSTGKGKNQKRVGDYGTTLGGAPLVMLEHRGLVISASGDAIFRAVKDAVEQIKIPKDNPVPRKASK